MVVKSDGVAAVSGDVAGVAASAVAVALVDSTSFGRSGIKKKTYAKEQLFRVSLEWEARAKNSL